MHFGNFNFGSLEIDGSTYEHDPKIGTAASVC